MFEAVFYVAICSGWLCRAVHGEESEIRTRHRYETVEQCKVDGETAARWAIGDSYPYRVVCQRIGGNR